MSKRDFCECGDKKDSRATRCSSCSRRSYQIDRDIDEYEKMLIECLQTSNSFQSAANKAGVDRGTITKVAKKYVIDLSHMRRGRGRPYEDSDIFCLSKISMPSTVKNRFLELFPEKNICSKCGIQPIWCGEKLQLQLHHKDGNSLNNLLENLTILCPNCHSQTGTYVGKKKGEKV